MPRSYRPRAQFSVKGEPHGPDMWTGGWRFRKGAALSPFGVGNNCAEEGATLEGLLGMRGGFTAIFHLGQSVRKVDFSGLLK